jgi:two-component system CheB/CheR fusion protein
LDPEERLALARALTVRKTSFFRDPSTWQWLIENIVPRLLADGDAAERTQLRAWSAGCCTGEEAYSLGMVLENACDSERSVHVVGTDLDLGAITVARLGRYTTAALSDIPSDCRRYVGDVGAPCFAIGKQLRRSVFFSPHDLLMQMPLQRMNLILCRNTIMYFSRDGQARALAKLYLSMTSDGVLMLGESEVPKAVNLFEPIDIAHHAWVKAFGSGSGDALKVLNDVGLRGPSRRGGLTV